MKFYKCICLCLVASFMTSIVAIAKAGQSTAREDRIWKVNKHLLIGKC
jgi:hypothetical protein